MALRYTQVVPNPMQSAEEEADAGANVLATMAGVRRQREILSGNFHPRTNSDRQTRMARGIPNRSSIRTRITSTCTCLSLARVIHVGIILVLVEPLIPWANREICGFPDCQKPSWAKATFAEKMAMKLHCHQNGKDGNRAIKIGCVGDSITAGATSTDRARPYPAQLQTMLDNEHGKGKYILTNMGACGATMSKRGDSPFWKTPQYKALTENQWDVIIIMLGTNDAKDLSDGGPDNWHHDCGGTDHTSLRGCSFASDYA